MATFRHSHILLPLLLAVLSLLLCIAPAEAQNTHSQREKRQKLEKEIAILDSQIKENRKQSANALSTLNLVRERMDTRRTLLQESEKEVSALQEEIDECQSKIDTIQGRLDTLTLYYSRLVRSAYKNRDSRIWYMYILSSDNLGQAIRRASYLRGLSQRMNVQATKIKQTNDLLQTQLVHLGSLKDSAEALRNLNLREFQAVRKEEAEANSIVKQLDRDKKKYQRQLSDKKKQVDALNREIERLVRAASKPSTATSSNKSSSSSSSTSKLVIDEALDKEFASNKGKLPWPVDGPIVERYGKRSNLQNYSLPSSNGISIAVTPGSRAHAIFDGEVKNIIVVGGYNQCVLIQHGRYFSFYCKLRNVTVKAGDKVKTGQAIGTVDTIDSETQIHFQIWNGTTPQNPETWLKK